MKIIFFGSDKFAVPSLEALTKAGYEILCIVTQPDRESGRGLSLAATVIKAEASKLNLPLYQPAKINTPESTQYLKEFNPDLFIVIAYGQILSKEILRTPKLFSLNLHASILPKYRGAAPINWAIINGERVTGVSIIKMNEVMDAGPLILQKELEILATDNAVTLEEKLSQLGKEALIESLQDIEKKKYKLETQNEKQKTFAPKLKKSDGLINWSKAAEEISNLIRGCYSWPGAFTYYQGKLLKIFKTRLLPLNISSACGEIVDINKDGIVVTTGKDALLIEELQLEGGKVISASDFALGHKITRGSRFVLKK
jgi:methionyl-tRNA formyltransferase